MQSELFVPRCAAAQAWFCLAADSQVSALSAVATELPAISDESLSGAGLATTRSAPHGACDCVPGAGCPSSSKCTPKHVLWLPLGDSITWGCNGPTIQDCHADSGSYRVPLALALTQHPLGSPDNVGFNISTMGTLTTGPPYVPAAWLKHEGHPGWQINTIDNILNQSLATSPVPPDLVTIHLGTPTIPRLRATHTVVSVTIMGAQVRMIATPKSAQRPW